MDSLLCKQWWNRFDASDASDAMISRCTGLNPKLASGSKLVIHRSSIPNCFLLGHKKHKQYIYTWHADKYPNIDTFSHILDISPRHHLCKCISCVVYLHINIPGQTVGTQYVISVLKLQEMSLTFLHRLNSNWVLKIYLDNSIFTNYIQQYLTASEYQSFRDYISYFITKYQDHPNLELYVSYCPDLLIAQTCDVEPSKRGLLRMIRFSQMTDPQVHTSVMIDADSVITPFRLYHFDHFSQSDKLVYCHEIDFDDNQYDYHLVPKIQYDLKLQQFIIHPQDTMVSHYSSRNDLLVLFDPDITIFNNYPNMLAGMIGFNCLFKLQYFQHMQDVVNHRIALSSSILKDGLKIVPPKYHRLIFLYI